MKHNLVAAVLIAGSLLTYGSASGQDACPDRTADAHVYSPRRLHLIEDCKTVTGKVVSTGWDITDGDAKAWLDVDSQYKDVLNDGNKKDQDGHLLIEVVCSHWTFHGGARRACKGYKNNVKIPKVGDRVIVKGQLVNDSHHGWNEIHPVYSIEKQ